MEQCKGECLQVQSASTSISFAQEVSGVKVIDVLYHLHCGRNPQICYVIILSCHFPCQLAWCTSETSDTMMDLANEYLVGDGAQWRFHSSGPPIPLIE